METKSTKTKKAAMGVHMGRNLERIRRRKDLKQAALGLLVNTTQQTISNLESQAVIEDDWLQKLSIALEVSVEEFKESNESAPVQIFEHSEFHNSQVGNTDNTYYMQLTEKVFETYERLIESEKEKVEIYKEHIRRLEELLKK